MASTTVTQPDNARPETRGAKPTAPVIAAEALLSAYVVVDEEIAYRRRAGSALVNEARAHFARADALERSRSEIRDAAAVADVYAQQHSAGIRSRRAVIAMPEAA